MADREFFSTSRFIAYPFVDEPAPSCPNELVLDAGFMMGIDSQFEVGHQVYLSSFIVGASQIVLVFTSDAPGAASHVWKFTFPFDTAVGTTVYADAELSGDPKPEVGSGFVTIGVVGSVSGLSPGTHTLAVPGRVEPALLQALRATFARTLNVANDPRRCPTPCCTSSSSNGGSGDTALVQGAGIVGAVKLKEGFNLRLEVRDADNTVQIGAAVGAGEGEPCQDIVIDEGGFRPGDSCISCDGFISSIAGAISKDGRMTLTGLPGVKVTNFPELHKIVVEFEERTCNG